jgi:hypothetical protein
MAAYADYSDYTGIYLGNQIAESEFPRLALRASEFLDRITGGQAALYVGEELLKKATCAVAEVWQTNEEGGEVVSQSVGSWSKSFASSAKTKDQRLLDAARMYLSQLGLIGGVAWA